MERPTTSGQPPRAARSSASSSTTTPSSSSSRATRAAGGKTSPPAIPEFTDEEYVLYLESPSWTKEDTLSLLDAVRIFDLEWNLVASTFHGDSRKTPSACRQRYQQLEELEADKRRLSVKRPSPTKQQPQQQSAPARPQTVTSPSPPTPQQKLPPRALQLPRQLPPSPTRQQPTQPQLHQQQPRPAQHTNTRILSSYGPPPITLGAGTTIFPLGPGSPFAFDPSAFMRGVNGHPQAMPSLFGLPQPLPSIYPNPALHPSFASLPSLPPLPSLSQALANAAPPSAPTSTAGPAISANRSASPNHSTPPSRQNSNTSTTNPVKPSAKPNVGISKLGAKSGPSTNNAHNANGSGNSNGGPAGKRQLVPISTNLTLPPPSGTSSSAAPSSSGSPSVVVISTEEWRKKRRRRTASEISRNFKCDIPTCSKAYGSEGALKMHIRLKHPGLRLPISKPQFPRPNPLLLSSFLPLGVGSVMLGQNAPTLGFPSPLPRLVPQQAKNLPTGLSPQLPGTSPVLGSSLPQQRPTAPLSDPVLRPQPSNSNSPTAVSVKREEVILSVAFLRLEIGGYECMSKTTGDLVAHFNFTHKRLLWEVVSGGGKLSILSVFDEVAGFGLEMLKDGSAVLTIEFSLPPEVSWEGNISMQHTIAKCKRHALHFPPHALNKPVELMLTLDERLRELANLGLPTLVDPYFTELDDSSSSSSSSDSDEDGPHSLGTRPQHKVPASRAPPSQRPSQSAGSGSPS